MHPALPIPPQRWHERLNIQISVWHYPANQASMPQSNFGPTTWVPRMQLKKPPTVRTSRCYNSGTIWTLHLAKVPKSIYASPDWFWGIRRVIRISAAFKSASKVRKILLFRCLRKSSEWVCKLEIKSKSSPYSITGTPGRTLQQCRPWHLLP